MQPSSVLPSTAFTTDQPSAGDRFDAWRSSISVLFDVAPLGHPDTGFHASVQAVHLGQLLVGDLQFGAQRFSRNTARTARDGLDHYLVQWYRSGGFAGEHGDANGLQVKAGDVVVFDMARSQHTLAHQSQVLSLVVPRKLGDSVLAGQGNGLHGNILPGDSLFGGLLTDHLAALQGRLPSITQEQADDVVHATMQMVAACLRPSQRSLAEARSEMQAVTLERLQRHIARHLGSALSPQTLCRDFGLPRHQLYQLFEPLGGVMRYVQQRRLQRAFQMLSTPAHRHLRVADVAARLGFSSEAHFSRAFRAMFQHTPSDVRAMSQAARAADLPGLAPRNSAEYADWLLGLMG
ncbi:MAG: helix-turn-helix domain-containing protein [Burkholderiaceae bacterium]|jgi:AraC-like DNA-binding protein|nr:helix-turn-helix domain-containing protein [Burkholderiaceae bacterium]